MQSATNHITVWDTGTWVTIIIIPLSPFSDTCDGCVHSGCPVDLLKYVGGKSVTLPSEYVSLQFSTNDQLVKN